MDVAVTEVQKLANFVADASWANISVVSREQLKIRVLDSLACAIGAQEGEPVRAIRRVLDDSESHGRSQLIGGGSSAPDRAAFYNGALVRYLDFNDSYLATGETCHPSDNIGAILAAGECAGAAGRDLLTAIAVAYQVQCRLSDVAPVRDRGFDHTTQLAYSAAAGVSKILGLGPEQVANAVAISGTALNALRVTRTGALSHWKGLAAPYTAASALELALLAQGGITGPLEVFEGNKGFMDTIAGHFEIDWRQEGLDSVQRTVLKKYNAEMHSQTAIEALLQLRAAYAIDAGQVTRIEVQVFDVAHKIIGGGEEGDKTVVRTKEEADHSLPYMLAVALLDGQVMPAQYRPERILRPDVQSLLCKIVIRPDPAFSARFPREMPARVRIELRDGRTYERVVSSLEPPSWQWAQQKFELLAGGYTSAAQRAAITDMVTNLERVQISELMNVLASLGTSRLRPSAA
jgi:2-methylcitrate dehydratase